MTSADVLREARELARRTYNTRYSRSGQRVTCRFCSLSWRFTAQDIREGATFELLEHAKAHALAESAASRGGAKRYGSERT